MNCPKSICNFWSSCGRIADMLAPVGNLFIRILLLDVFFRAGLLKIQTWDTTVMLFQHEYSVPLLPPICAAYLGTAIELVIPVIIVLGLFGRLPVLILFLFNIMAVVSYPYLLTESGAVGFQNHFYWGVMIGVILLYGYDKLSLDYLIKRLRKK